MRNASAKELNDEIYRRYGDPGRALRQIRKEMTGAKPPIKQSELARASGYNPSHICRWLSEKPTTHVVPTLETRMILAESLERLLSDRDAGAGSE